jgi:hypothetical protein
MRAGLLRRPRANGFTFSPVILLLSVSYARNFVNQCFAAEISVLVPQSPSFLGSHSLYKD